MKKPLEMVQPDPRSDLVDMLKDLIERVNEGDVTDLLVIAKTKSAGLTTFRNMDFKNSFEFLGYLEWSKWRLEERIGGEYE